MTRAAVGPFLVSPARQVLPAYRLPETDNSTSDENRQLPTAAISRISTIRIPVTINRTQQIPPLPYLRHVCYQGRCQVGLGCIPPGVTLIVNDYQRIRGGIRNAWRDGHVITVHRRGARDYVEADRSRADDYYLAEGTGIAQRFAADGDGLVVELAPLDGDGYEAWVAGLDPGTGEPKGRLRTDGRAVRFVEVTVNGPKSWSLAAELHPDIAAAYEAAQDQAATQIIGWLAQHATARVGPRGGQVQVPVDRLEAVTVRHYTSRAGDPHRHLHLQINSRVWAAGAWRGLHTVGVRDSLDAINGVGHAAMMTDPAFRHALAAHGYVLTRSGEIEQLAPFVGAFSKRAAQIAAQHRPLRTRLDRGAPGRTTRPGTASGVGRPGVGRRPPGQGDPGGGGGPARPVAGRTRRPGLRRR